MSRKWTQSPLYRLFTFPYEWSEKDRALPTKLALAGYYSIKIEEVVYVKNHFTNKIKIPLESFDAKKQLTKYTPKTPDTPVDIPKFSKDVFLNYASHRALTFMLIPGWTDKPDYNIIQVAQCGFYFTGIAEGCRCHFCGVMVYEWPVGKTPPQLHSELSPSCTINTWTAPGNVPIGMDVVYDVAGLSILQNLIGMCLALKKNSIVFKVFFLHYS
jgi:hypothetical protein